MKLAVTAALVAFGLASGSAFAFGGGAKTIDANVNGVFQSQSGKHNKQEMEIGYIGGKAKSAQVTVKGADIKQTQEGKNNRQYMGIGVVESGHNVKVTAVGKNITQKQTGRGNDQHMGIGVVR